MKYSFKFFSLFCCIIFAVSSCSKTETVVEPNPKAEMCYIKYEADVTYRQSDVRSFTVDGISVERPYTKLEGPIEVGKACNMTIAASAWNNITIQGTISISRDGVTYYQLVRKSASNTPHGTSPSGVTLSVSCIAK